MGFAKAVDAVFAGGELNAECPKEPLWLDIYPRVPPPGSPPEQIAEARAFLATQPLRCAKLQINATACHGCKDNPRQKSDPEGQRAIRDYALDLERIGALHSAVRMGLVANIEAVPDEDFDMLRCYWNAVERENAKPGNENA